MLSNSTYQKPTILQVIPSLSTGGVERMVCELAQYLNSLNYKSLVLTSGGALVPELSTLGVTIIEANIATKNPLLIFKNVKLIQDLITEYQIDIIHVHSRAPAWSCYFATKNTKVKLVTSFHGIYNIFGIFKKFYNAIMTKGQKIIAVSNFVKSHILANYSVPEEKIKVIFGGVDCHLFNMNQITSSMQQNLRIKYSRLNSKVPTILLPARMTHWKGHLLLLEALNLIKGEFICLLVGDQDRHPNFVARIVSKIKKFNLIDKVFLYPSERNMPALYSIADIIVSASLEPEAFGLTIIEAQAMEKLVIAANLGGASETIINGETGFHFILNDHFSLAQKIEDCLAILGSVEVNKITEQARFHVQQNFSTNAMQKATVDLYHNLIQ